MNNKNMTSATEQEEEEEEDDDDDLSGGSGADDVRRKGVAIGGGATMQGLGGSGGGSSMKNCQAERCSADLNEAKTYHRRHKVCKQHAKAPVVVVVAGIQQRFCQQCSRFCGP